ncbi:MAG: glycosyltransferase family 9 protein, partial [Pyrinomonadaceae bacterium]
LNFNPQNVLIIDFGQLGDVVLSLPALNAVRQKFPSAKITVAIGKSCATVIDLAQVADEKIIVDRVALRDGAKLKSIFQITKLIREVRRRKFDFVIDLHSLPETNLLAFLSGANKRLLSQRESRSLDFLGSWSLRPPREDKKRHATDRYLDALKPLGIETFGKNVDRIARLNPRQADLEFAEKLWMKHKVEGLVVGLFPGAGHPSRRWGLENFASLADFLTRNERVRIAVFLGPEEREMSGKIKQIFPKNTIVFDNLKLPQLIAAQANLSLFVSNDTGPMHLAAAVGTSVVLLIDKDAPQTYIPLIPNIKVVRHGKIDEIRVETVYEAASELLGSNRVSRLFN